MRGLKNSESGSSRQYYMTIGKGVFTRRVEEGTPGAVSRTLKKGPNEGKLVHELHCNAIEGALVSFHIDESPWGKQWKITLDITTGEDGASHQANEDIAIMRALPNMTVIVPADAVEGNQSAFPTSPIGRPRN